MSGKNVPGQHFEQLQGPATQADTAAAERSVLSKVSGKFKGAVLALCAAGNLAACAGNTPNAPVAELANPAPAASASETPTASTTTEKKESAEGSIEQRAYETVYRLYNATQSTSKSKVPNIGDAEVNNSETIKVANIGDDMVLFGTTSAFNSNATVEYVNTNDITAPADKDMKEYLQNGARAALEDRAGQAPEFNGYRIVVLKKNTELAKEYNDPRAVVFIRNENSMPVNVYDNVTYKTSRNAEGKVFVTVKGTIKDGDIAQRGAELSLNGTKVHLPNGKVNEHFEKSFEVTPDQENKIAIEYPSNLTSANSVTKEVFDKDGTVTRNGTTVSVPRAEKLEAPTLQDLIKKN